MQICILQGPPFGGPCFLQAARHSPGSHRERATLIALPQSASVGAA